jgi:hypothetical protein
LSLSRNHVWCDFGALYRDFSSKYVTLRPLSHLMT